MPTESVPATIEGRQPATPSKYAGFLFHRQGLFWRGGQRGVFRNDGPRLRR